MYTGTCATYLFEKITASLHHDLDMASELLAGLGHRVPREVCHHLCDVDRQRGSGVVGALWRSPSQTLLKSRRLSLWTGSIDVQHRHGHAACSMSMGMNLHHGNGRAWYAWTWTCSMDMDMQHGLRHAARTWHSAWTRTCSMDLDMLLVWPLKCCQMWFMIPFYTFTVIPARRLPLRVALTFSSTFISSDNWQLLFLLQG